MENESLENTIITLHGKGWSICRILDALLISRKRIRQVLVSNSVLRDTTPGEVITPKKKRQSKLDPYKEFIAELLGKYPDITGHRVYEHLREKEYDGKTTILRDYLSSIRQVVSKTPVRLVETDPGQRGAHDWSDFLVRFTLTGKTEIISNFSYILSYSRRQYIEVVDDKSQKTLLRALINAFIYLDGVPKEIRSDNQKACVDRRKLGQPVFNNRYLEFAT